ncbi:MAG: nucleotidyltransferase domain-containing protein [Synergistaceae bacterium]|nr:nucleotidyltransferase domain-containing protein [Synergistaceae bacterium]MBR0094952.1 nucleotidyltransferase domain-containing protein [Synergistaceae bacterium]
MPFTISEIEEKVIPVAKLYGVARVSVFGSYARGEADDASDVDILIHKGNLNGLIDYFSFVQELEKIFGCHVDVVTSGIDDKKFLDKIEREEILLYATE